MLKQVADDWSTEVTDESLLQITIDSSGWAPTDITSQPVDDLVGIRIGVYVGSSVGGVRLGTVTEAVGIDGGTSFSVLFDDGSTEMLDTNALCPHEYFLLSDGPLMPEGPRLIRRSSANTMRSRFSADKTYKPSTDVVLSADTLDVNVTVQVHWPLRGNVVNGLIVSLEGDGDRPCVVDFVDGTRARCVPPYILHKLTFRRLVPFSQLPL